MLSLWGNNRGDVSRRLRLTSPLTLVLLVGCVVGPDFERPEDFLEPMERLLAALEGEAALHAVGRVTMYDRVVDSLVCRRSAQDYVSRHPEILDEQIEQPVVIVGLGRTGSTMLHRLRSEDPDVFSVRWWECRHTSPYPRSD